MNDLTNLGEVMQSVMIKGDLSKLTPMEQVNYYNAVCKSIGLNPLTKPLEYIWLNGKLTLYALRACADQLRKIYSVSVTVLDRKIMDDLLIVHVQATTPDGRKDEDFGVVPLPPGLKGEARSNQIMKGVTKAKRRVTLSITGLGFLDETEIESIPDRAKVEATTANGAVAKSIEEAKKDLGSKQEVKHESR